MRRHAPRKIYTRHLGVCGATRVLPRRTICISHNNAQCGCVYSIQSYILFIKRDESIIQTGIMRHGANTHIVRDDSLLSETKGRPEDPVDRWVDASNKRMFENGRGSKY